MGRTVEASDGPQSPGRASHLVHCPSTKTARTAAAVGAVSWAASGRSRSTRSARIPGVTLRGGPPGSPGTERYAASACAPERASRGATTAPLGVRRSTAAAITARVGQTVSSPEDSTRVVVVRTPDRDVNLTCGGLPMVEGEVAASAGTRPGAEATKSVIGKRYIDESGSLELLCTRSGAGAVESDGVPLIVKVAKALPSSD